MNKVDHLTIKHLPREERPRERLIKYGADALSTAELLAIMINTGTATETAVEVATRLLASFGDYRHLCEASIEELGKTKGIGLAKAAKIKAAIELGQRICKAGTDNKVRINSPEDVVNLLAPEMRYLSKEHFKAVLLNTKNYVISVETVSVGSLDSSLVHPRELFKEAIKRSSAGIILVHNHPSGDPTPSTEDIKVTQKMCNAGKILGIEVLDHVIIGDNRYSSLREKGFCV